MLFGAVPPDVTLNILIGELCVDVNSQNIKDCRYILKNAVITGSRLSFCGLVYNTDKSPQVLFAFRRLPHTVIMPYHAML